MLPSNLDPFYLLCDKFLSWIDIESYQMLFLCLLRWLCDFWLFLTPLGRVIYASTILTCNFLFWWFLPLVLVLEWLWLYRGSLRVFSFLQSFIFFFERVCLWRPPVLGFLYWKFSFVYPFKEPALDFVDFLFPLLFS